MAEDEPCFTANCCGCDMGPHAVVGSTCKGLLLHGAARACMGQLPEVDRCAWRMGAVAAAWGPPVSDWLHARPKRLSWIG